MTVEYTMPIEAEFWIWVGAAVLVTGLGFAALARSFCLPRLLPNQRIRAVPWNGAFCFLVFFALYAPREIINGLYPKNLVAALIASVVSLPIILAAILLIMRQMFGRPLPLGDFRFRDVVAGFASWFVFGAVALLVHLVVRAVAVRMGQPPTSEHVFIEALQNEGWDWTLWSLIAIEATLCAPIREEFLFRGIIQPWAACHRRGGETCLLIAAVASLAMRGGAPSTMSLLAPLIFVVLTAGILYVVEPTLRRFLQLASRPASAVTAYRGIMGVALLFAMFHVNSWPDPIPLSLLGLGLGWLAWRRQGIGASIVCHSLFNLTTLLQLRIIQLLHASAAT